MTWTADLKLGTDTNLRSFRFLRELRWTLAWRGAAASTVLCWALVALGTRCRFAPLFLIAWFADDQDRPACIGRQYYVGARYRFVL